MRLNDIIRINKEYISNNKGDLSNLVLDGKKVFFEYK